jgi:hypothetical protein
VLDLKLLTRLQRTRQLMSHYFSALWYAFQALNACGAFHGMLMSKEHVRLTFWVSINNDPSRSPNGNTRNSIMKANGHSTGTYLCEISGSHGGDYEVYRVFWDVDPCSHVEVDRRFRGAYCLHHQGDEYAAREKIAGYIVFGGVRLSRHNIKFVDLPPRKITSFFRSLKDDLGLKTPGVYRTPCECRQVCFGQTVRSIDIRISNTTGTFVWLIRTNRP